MNETIIQFGENRDLAGIVTKPDSGEQSDTSILLLNAGLIHRVGFNRFNTDFARVLVNDGYPSLRFDLHGIGDSEKFNGETDYDLQSIIDIQYAISALLENTGTNRCILIGLCSGADNAHIVALKDSRVCGIVFLDGYAYPTIGFYVHDYVKGIINPFKILRFFYKTTRKLFKNKRIITYKELYVRNFPSKKRIIPEIQSLIDRDIKLYYIYSGGMRVYYNSPDQFYAMFRKVKFKNNVSYTFFPDADHTYTSISMREELKNTIRTWILRTFDTPQQLNV